MKDIDPIVINEKKVYLDLALRNALKFATGQIKYTRDIGFQLDYIMENANKETRLLIADIFRNKGVFDKI